MNKLSRFLSELAANIDIYAARHAMSDAKSKCNWTCKPLARIADGIRKISNLLWGE